MWAIGSFGLVAVAMLAAAGLGAGASAAVPLPGWVISWVAQPTDFSTADKVNCEAATFFLCDQYV